MTTDTALKAYFDEAASWDADRVAQQRRVVRWSVAVAAAGWLCAMAAVIALTAVMPPSESIHLLCAWTTARELSMSCLSTQARLRCRRR